MIRKTYPWDVKDLTYREFGSLNYDWLNSYKVSKTVQSYLFRYDGYNKGLTNEYIMKSTFGRLHISDILKEIDYWFNKCIGAYSEIEIN